MLYVWPITMLRWLIILATLYLAATGTFAAADETATRDDLFETKVFPLLKSRCGDCHGASEKKSGLSVLTVGGLLSGGATRGAAIVPGHPEESVLVKLVSGKLKPRMPFKGEPLSAAEIAL